MALSVVAAALGGGSGAKRDVVFSESSRERERKGHRDFPWVAQPPLSGPGQGARLPGSAGISASPVLRAPVALCTSLRSFPKNRSVLGAGDVEVYRTQSLPEGSLSR